MTKKEFDQIFSDFIENANGEVILKLAIKNAKQWEAPWESTCKRFFLYDNIVCCLYLYNGEMFLYAGATYKITCLKHLLMVLDKVSGEIPLIFILTGPDNVGKSTIARTLSEMFLCDTVHLNAVYGSTNEETWKNHQKLYNDIAYTDTKKSVVYDRFIHDEYVYGPKYRNGSPDEIMGFIHKIENLMTLKGNVVFVSLTGDPEFLEAHDDGKSLSLNKRENIEYEIEAFKITYYNSEFTNKKYVKVNQGTEFRNITDIIKEILS